MSLSDFGHAIPQGKSAGTQDASAGVDKGVYGTAYKSAYGSESSDWSGWTVPCDGYDPADEGRREAIFALGNGLFVTRAATTFSRADNVHYPGTYRAGCYDRAESYIAGQQEVNVSLVNLPNWLPLDFSVQDGPWFSLDEVCLQDYCHSLDMRRGVAIRRFAFTDKEGRQTQVVERRLVSMAEPHLAAVQLQITPQNWHGRVKVRSCLDGGLSLIHI